MGETAAYPAAAPRQGEVFLDPRAGGRALRVTWHPESRTVVLSLWRGEQCVGTHRLPAAEVSRLVLALMDGAVSGAVGDPAGDATTVIPRVGDATTVVDQRTGDATTVIDVSSEPTAG